jgi:hypothetical protein
LYSPVFLSLYELLVASESTLKLALMAVRVAIRLTTLVIVPVKSVCIAVKPVSNGDCARASAGKRTSRVRG